jgi:polygalacturonase
VFYPLEGFKMIDQKTHVNKMTVNRIPIVLLLGIVLNCGGTLPKKSGWDLVPTILQSITPPVFPDHVYNIESFGAKGDGKTNSWNAIQQAIDSCHAAGGGRVEIPQGVFFTGAIRLRSGVNLHLTKQAVLLFSQNTRDYPMVFTRFEGVECMNFSPFIYAFEQENMAITGEGTLDGQADTLTWWPWAGKSEHGWDANAPDQEQDRNALFQMGEDNVPVSQRIFGEGHFLRTSFIQFYRCRNILIEGVSIKRSPMWEIHPVLCENIIVQNVNIETHGPNNDGCNPESSKNVLIKDCYFNVGDDCIAIKSGRNGDGRRINKASENIIIQGCTMRDGHGGVVIGSEVSGDCRNVFTEDCVMDSPELDRALRIKTNSMRGGIIENIFMRNVEVGEVCDAVVLIDYHYGEGDIGNHPPVVRNVEVSHVTSRKSNYGLYLNGYERSFIQNIRIINCEFNGVAKGNWVNHVAGLSMDHVIINGQIQN